MKVTWYVDVRVPFANLKRILYGILRIEHKDEYATVQDANTGFNLVRVDWDETDPASAVQRHALMSTMRHAAELRYNEMKANNERTL